MNIKDIDFTKKENQTFKNWFKVMWGNFYIIPFIAALVGLIVMLVKWYDEPVTYLVALLPIAICSAIGHNGFYQYWEDLKKGKSR